jgi:hypothetical protein
MKVFGTKLTARDVETKSSLSLTTQLVHFTYATLYYIELFLSTDRPNQFVHHKGALTLDLFDRTQ